MSIKTGANLVGKWLANESLARSTLAVVWVGSFSTAMGVTAYLYLTNQIEGDNFNSALGQLNTSYTAYVGVVLTFALTAVKAKKAGGRRASFLAGLAASLVWNLVILALLMRLLFHMGTIEESVEQIGYFSTRLSWLVGPVLGYYFGRTAIDKPEATAVRRA